MFQIAFNGLVALVEGIIGIPAWIRDVYFPTMLYACNPKRKSFWFLMLGYVVLLAVLFWAR
jgi:hypothetical protein